MIAIRRSALLLLVVAASAVACGPKVPLHNIYTKDDYELSQARADWAECVRIAYAMPLDGMATQPNVAPVAAMPLGGGLPVMGVAFIPTNRTALENAERGKWYAYCMIERGYTRYTKAFTAPPAPVLPPGDSAFVPMQDWPEYVEFVDKVEQNNRRREFYYGLPRIEKRGPNAKKQFGPGSRR